MRILQALDIRDEIDDVNDVIELYHLGRFLEEGMFSAEVLALTRSSADAIVARVRSTVGRFFGSVRDGTLEDVLGTQVDWQYRKELLDLLGRHGAWERCSPERTLDVLSRAGFGLGSLLTDQRLVRAHGPQLRDRILADAVSAEYVVRKHFEGGSTQNLHLPSELTNADARSLLLAYVESPTPHPNVVQLIASARITTGGIVDVHVKRAARRRHEQLIAEVFENTTGLTTGVELLVRPDQLEPVDVQLDGMVLKYSYSQSWLDESTDPASIMNNLMYVFLFVTDRVCLTMPAKQANLGLVDSLFTTRGREDYPATSFFRLNEGANLLQMNLYEQFLRSKGVELESVYAWVINEYMETEYGIRFLRFSTSAGASTYLQRCIHLLVQMESIAKQYSLYVGTGGIDGELLALSPDQVQYRSLPSLIPGKYVYASENVEGQNVRDLLFSNQSGLGYIDDDLREETLAHLVTRHRVAREQFHDYQRARIEYLEAQGVLVIDGLHVAIADSAQFSVLRDVFQFGSASFFHYRSRQRHAMDELVARGWLVRASSLLTGPEAQYFNYVLNQVDFADGPNLRNRYLHASHVDPTDETEHYRSYLVILKMVAALIIKINDDLWIRDVELAEG